MGNHSHIDPTGNAMLPAEQMPRRDEQEPYMSTSMTQEDWDEFAAAMRGMIEACATFTEVLVKFEDDLPLTTKQREAIRALRR